MEKTKSAFAERVREAEKGRCSAAARSGGVAGGKNHYPQLRSVCGDAERPLFRRSALRWWGGKIVIPRERTAERFYFGCGFGYMAERQSAVRKVYAFI